MLDQPAGRWLGAQRAGWLWNILEQEQQATMDYPIEKRLRESELTFLIETIRPLRQKMLKDKANE